MLFSKLFFFFFAFLIQSPPAVAVDLDANPSQLCRLKKHSCQGLSPRILTW